MTRIALLAVFGAALALAPAAFAGPSIGVCNGASPSPACVGGTFNSTDGVYFVVGTGGGNRDFASVAVDCGSSYSTVLTVEVPPKGVGSSQTIHPPSGAHCTATLEKLMQIGKARVLAGPVAFVVS
jgi:hypothetical protein